MMIALQAGRTLRTFGIKTERLEIYFEAHPEYATEARPLIKSNRRAALYHKGDALRCADLCRAGLHPMAGDNIFMDGTHGR
jgi:hypothetical protein